MKKNFKKLVLNKSTLSNLVSQNINGGAEILGNDSLGIKIDLRSIIDNCSKDKNCTKVSYDGGSKCKCY